MQEKDPNAFHAPRTSKPGPEVFRKWEERKRKLKGRVKRAGGTVKSMGMQNFAGPTGFGPQLASVLQIFQNIFGLGAQLKRMPVSRMSNKLQSYRDSASNLVTKASEFPNRAFGTLRSKRETEEVENEVKGTLSEVAVAHQRNWFNYLKSYESKHFACQEWDYCRTALENNAFSTRAAKDGGKLLR